MQQQMRDQGELAAGLKTGDAGTGEPVDVQSAAPEEDAQSLAPEDVSALTPEDVLRAQLYAMLSHYLSAAPKAADLELAATLTGDNSPLGRRISKFASIAAKTSAETAAEAYQDLFIGLGRGELVPYGSYYLTGFLHEKPLAQLRRDMARLGAARDTEATEPEDHIASVLELMAGFIDGRFGAPLALGAQKQFYQPHVGAWAGHFFGDLEAVQSSPFYAALGKVGRAFMEIEDAAFDMVK